jgi:uncharacterized membrane protein
MFWEDKTMNKKALIPVGILAALGAVVGGVCAGSYFTTRETILAIVLFSLAGGVVGLLGYRTSVQDEARLGVGQKPTGPILMAFLLLFGLILSVVVASFLPFGFGLLLGLIWLLFLRKKE